MSVPLPVRAGDRGVLRDPGRQTVAGGVLVLDADPPALRRRGAAAARARELAAMDGTFDAALEVARRGVVAADRLRALGGRSAMPPGARIVGPWVVAERQWDEWCAAAAPTVAEHARRKPLEDGMPVAALRRALDMPDDAVATAVALAAGLPVARGRVGRASGESLGPLEDSIKSLERRLAGTPFAAPETAELAELALGRRELAAAERAGRLLRVTGEIVLLPDAPQRAAERLRELPQPFTTSAARQALGTTRRVAIPLLEYLDAHGLTERIDGNTRRLR
jgi:selenocysteine-specific elongation factor